MVTGRCALSKESGHPKKLTGASKKHTRGVKGCKLEWPRGCRRGQPQVCNCKIPHLKKRLEIQLLTLQVMTEEGSVGKQGGMGSDVTWHDSMDKKGYCRTEIDFIIKQRI
jgi:hypothetical protein